MSGTTVRPGAQPDDLLAALKSAGEAPEDDSAWEDLEEIAAKHQLPDDVSALYREVLSRVLSRDVAERIATRAVRFHDEWFGEEGPLLEVLERLLAIDPTVSWAFERASLLHTVAERWDALLSLYDRALGATTDVGRRQSLLQEAANAAKDFAGQTDRAIGYLHELVKLAPADGQRAAALERLLEQRGRHADLVALWRARVAVLPAALAQPARVRIATTELDLLKDPAAALATLRATVAEKGEEEAAYRLLERVGAVDTDVKLRRAALDLVKDRYAAAGRGADVIRVLEAELALVEGDAQAAVHRELEGRLTEAGQLEEARKHAAAVLGLMPEDDAALARLEALARETGHFTELADALAAAADGATAARAVALRSRAARVRADDAGDEAGAIALYARVLDDEAIGAAAAREAGLSMATLLERAGRKADLLAVVERLAAAASDDADRRTLWARAATLSEELGNSERALSAWEHRLAKDATDREAEDAVIELFDRLDRAEPLVLALERRAAAQKDPIARRADLVRATSVLSDRLGDPARGIVEWRAIEKAFGRDEETSDALTRLLHATESWDDLATLLAELAPVEKEPKRRARAHRRLGDVLREHLGQASRSVAEYKAALEIDPKDGGARGGLESLLDDASCRGAAVEALVAACGAADDWQGTLALLDARLELAGSDDARALLLLEAAETAEARGKDLTAALGYVGRAFALSPDDASLEREVRRMAESTGAWSAAADAYRGAIAVAKGAQADALRMQLGAILEGKTADLVGALAVFDQVRRAAPGDVAAARAVVRAAGAAGAWDAVAAAWLEHAGASGAIEPDLVSEVESAAASGGGWDGLAGAVSVALEGAALSPAIAHALEVRLGTWHRDHRDDRGAAEHAFVRAVAHNPDDVATLHLLADLQRGAPGPELVSTLLRLADLGEDPLATLREAAGVALDHGLDAREILADLHRRACEAWKKGKDERAAEVAAWSLDRLVASHEAAGEHARAVELLAAGAELPFSRAEAHALLHRAASIAAGPLAGADRAIELYRKILAENRDDLDAVLSLAELYESAGMLADLVAIRRHELSLSPPIDRRLLLRLGIARSERELGDTTAATATLQASLAESPGDRATLGALSDMLGEGGHWADLVATQEAQATALAEEDPSRAAELLAQAAEVVERHLGEPARASALLGKAVALGESPTVLDSLARLAAAAGDHPAAVRWLERRLARAQGDERPSLLLRHADALVASGREPRARASLESALAEHPGERALAQALAGLYRRTLAWQPLVELLAGEAEHEADASLRVALLMEIADVQRRRLSAPDLAVESLERATALAPEDRGVRAALADALRVAGRLDEARSRLEALVEEYGRRRPAERANLHYQLAEVAHARGDLKEALSQLDVAASMDMAHAGVLQLLGQLAAESGQLERAERAYRALLLVVRRHKDAAPVGQAETLLALSRIAEGLGDPGRAGELLETAFEAAGESDREAERFEAALRAGGKDALLLRALQARVQRSSGKTGEARALAELGALLSRMAGHEAEAVDLLLRAVEMAPADGTTRGVAREVTSRAGAPARLAAVLQRLFESTRTVDPGLAAEIGLDLARVHEVDAHDAAAALVVLEELSSAGLAISEALGAQVRIARSLGDRVAERAALTRIVEAGADEVPAAAQVEALYGLATLELSDASTRSKGIDTLQIALERDAQPGRAAEILKAAVTASEDRMVAAAYERVARTTGDPATLLDAIERVTALGEDLEAFGPVSRAGGDLFREGVELALSLGDGARAEKILQRAAEIASEGNSAFAVWALTGLAERRNAAGDAAGAARWLARAVEVAEPGDAWTLGMELATLAAGPLGDLALAASTYERLLERDPSDRAVWEPLLDVYRRMGARDRLDRLIATTVDAVFDAGDRRRLRMERARLLLDAGRDDDAATVLREIVDDDRDDLDAAELLAGVLERHEREDELVEVLARMVEAARSRAEVEPVVAITVRYANRLAKTADAPRRADAIDALRASLDAVSDDRRLLTPLLALLGVGDDPRDRADVMARLLRVEDEANAGDLALALAELNDGMEDDDAALSALSEGFTRAPADTRVRARLEERYRRRGDLSGLAGMWVIESARLPGADAVARLREAAETYRDRLGDAAAAVDALRRARRIAPEDGTLVGELVRSLDASGDVEGAIMAASEAIDATHGAPRAALLHVRATVLLGRKRDAVEDLEAAVDGGHHAAMDDLVHALEARVAASREHDVVRAATLRIADLVEASDAGRAAAGLRGWLDRSPDDLDALTRLLGVETHMGDWEAVAETCRRIIGVDSGEAQIDAAVRLVDAATRLGRPAEAREGLERVLRIHPGEARLRDELRRLYVAIGATRELAALALAEADAHEDAAGKLASFREAGALFLSAGDPGSAIDPLRRALEIRAGDHDSTVQLADALTATSRLEEATALVDAAVAGHKGRRSKELAVLQHRMARIAFAAGDRNVELAWLNVALDADMQNGEVATELAVVATELGQVDPAMKALRAITMMKNPGPMTKAEAYLRQGMIAHHQGDARRAALLARKALSEDSTLESARQFLRDLGERV